MVVGTVAPQAIQEDREVVAADRVVQVAQLQLRHQVKDLQAVLDQVITLEVEAELEKPEILMEHLREVTV